MADNRVFDPFFRKSVIQEIKNNDNKERKKNAWKRLEVYKDRQDQFVEEKLKKEFGEQTTKEMRKITSINLTKKIVDKQASIYLNEPERIFPGSSVDEEIHIKNLYEESKANVKLKKSNKILKLQDQSCLMVIPKEGIIQLRPLHPHQYDVIPSSQDPEKASIYVLNILDKAEYLKGSDNINQKIADPEDYKESLERFIWWTDGVNFETDNEGNIIPPNVVSSNVLQNGMIINPIGTLPFIDIATDKDLEFWVRQGKNKVEFSIDFAALMSDLWTIIKLQGYAQAVVVAEEKPENIITGPTRVLFLKATSTTQIQPSFQFISPSPDVQAALEALNATISLFLTAEGLDPKIISGKSESEKFSSGVERLLAMIEKFEATKDDLDLYKWIEQKLFNLFRLWNNVLQGTDFFIEKLKGPIISDNTEIVVNFSKPEIIKTQEDIENSVIRRLKESLITKKEAIMELRGIDEKQAEEIIKMMDEESLNNIKKAKTLMGGFNGEDQGDDEGQREIQPSGDV